MHPTSPGRRPQLRHGDTSSSSLRGLERPIPPRQSDSTRSSHSDINKPLPPTPHIDKSTASSLYSTEIDSLIDLYLSGSSTPYNLFSDASRSLQSLPFEYAPPGLRNVYQDEKFSVSESVLRNIHTLGHNDRFHSIKTEFGASKYRYSTPEPRSPSLPNLVTWELPVNGNSWSEDPARTYRDTLLPAPFTPISTKSPELFQAAIPLRGPRPLNSPPLHEQPQSWPRSPALATSSKNFFPEEMSGSSYASSRDSDTREEQLSDLRSQLNNFSWNQRPQSHIAELETPHMPFSYTNSPASSLSEPEIQMRPRPAPAQYQAAYEIEAPSESVSRSSLSSSVSRFDLNSRHGTPPPTNWSPMLKPSNPDIPRIPRAERSPAVGLSAYQALGPKAWEEDEAKEKLEKKQKKPKKGLFGRRKNDGKAPMKEPDTLQLTPNTPAQAPGRPMPTSPGYYSSPLASPEGYFPQFNPASSTTSRPGLQSSGQSSPTQARSRANTTSILGKSSPKLKRPDSLKRLESDKSNKTMSWIAARKKKDKTDAWREDFKKRITIISVQDSMGLSGDSALLRDTPVTEYSASAPAQAEWFSAPSSSFSPQSERDTPAGSEGSGGGWI